MIESADERFRGLAIHHLYENVQLMHLVERLMHEADHQLVLPPDHPRTGDQFLGNGTHWHSVVDGTYQLSPFGRHSYLVRRPTEHRRMLRFFFGDKG